MALFAGKRKLFWLAAAAGGIWLLLKMTGVWDNLSLEHVVRLKAWIDGYGVWGPAAYVALCVLMAAFALPGTVTAILAGVAFGAVKGAACAVLGGVVANTIPFLIARHWGRAPVERWLKNKDQLRRLDEGVLRHGWRMLMVTRLIPLIPYGVQNYAYGLTAIPLPTYVVITAVCMLPGTLAVTFAAGILTGGGDIRSVLAAAGAPAALFAVLLLLAAWLVSYCRRRYFSAIRP